MKIITLMDKSVLQINSVHVFYLVGILIFIIWLVRTSFGTNALSNSKPRRNNLSVYMPFMILFAWVCIYAVAFSITEKFFSKLPDWQNVFLEHLIQCICGLAVTIATLFIAREHFARRLSGFGLNTKTIFKDFFIGTVNLISVWPFVFLIIWVTAYFGQLIFGPDFQMTKHQELQALSQYTQTSLRIVILINGALIAPILEEILFRGFFQSLVRSYLSRPWTSILITSIIFVAAHMNKSHWPALFVLALCLGYAYEKSGSLFRPIFIHSIFNATALISTMLL